MKGLRKLTLQKKFVALFLVLSFLGLGIPKQVQAEESKLNVGQVYSGFKLVEDKPIKEMEASAKIFKHVKSGANLIYLQNGDENKVFSIGFYTPPTDDTGVNHILEHSVLYGSEKYPVKSPLAEVGKQSVSNFANAITSNDKTIFPFATTNYKDYKNVMGIYMDAVFNPIFKRDPRIFQQQAWRYELNSKTEDITYNGVVYNEMKGNYANPARLLQTTILKSLFPDTLYNWEAGGNPQVIPQLTYEKALEVYNKNYHPSNSYIFVYGKLDILDTLKFLNDEYLSKFEKVEFNTKIPEQKPFEARKELIASYPVQSGVDLSKNHYLSLNYAIDLKGSTEDIIGLQLLSYMLLESESAPLKVALLQSGFGTAVNGGVATGTKQPVFQITVSGSNSAYKDKYVEFVDMVLASIVKEGLDKNFIQSVFNSAEMSLRIQKTAGMRGISYGELVMQGWLYEGNPTIYLEFEKSLETIKKSINDGYFEKLIKKYFVDNKHSSIVVLQPKAALDEEIAQGTKKALADYKKSLSEAQIEALVQKTKDFKAWQNIPDSKEALNTIPSLSLSDIDTDIKTTPSVEKQIGGTKVLHTPIYTDKLAYVNMYFDSSTVPEDKLQYLYLLSAALGRLDTKNYSQTELIYGMLNYGGAAFTPTTIEKFKDGSVYYPKFKVTTVSMSDNLEAMMSLTGEIISNTQYDNKEALRLIVSQLKANLDSFIPSSPDTIADSRIQSYLSAVGKYNEAGGLEFYNFICDLEANFDQNYKEIVANLSSVSKLVFNKRNLITGVTLEEGEYNKFEKSFSTLLAKLPDSASKQYNYKLDNTAINEGFILPGNVQYIAKGYNINELGYKYNGKMAVLAKILTTEYLMNEVREKGGAYGSSIVINKNGNVLFTSYRDPNLSNTLKTFDKAAEFLRNFKADEKQMTSYILGLVNSYDQLLDPMSRGIMSETAYIAGEKAEDTKKLQEEMLSTTASDIAAFADMIEAIVKKNIYCVIGNEQVLKENSTLFSSIENLADNSLAPTDKVIQLIQKAKSTLLLEDYYAAYAELAKLSAEEQKVLLPEFNSLTTKLYTADLVQATTAFEKFAKSPSLKKFYELGSFIDKTVKNKENKSYLLSSLINEGHGLVYTEDVNKAIDAIAAVLAKKSNENIKAAEKAVSAIQNKETKQWLLEELGRLKK